MSDAENTEKTEKKVDDEWKKKAEEEKARLEEERPEHAHESMVPPATFMGLLGTFAVQAAFSLGEIKSPTTGESHFDLAMARYVIDTLAMLETKTKGNLELPEERALKNTLTELRFKFVQAAQAARAAQAPQSTPGQDATPGATSRGSSEARPG